jgi:hypothetical protein
MREVISRFGAQAKAKLANPGATGAPEDQLRAPLEELIRSLAVESGIVDGWVALVGESTLAELGTRPDYAVTVRKALVGFIEVKAPGKGADPRRFTDPHDKRQWAKLKSLPNLMYTDGQSFSVWRDGELFGPILHLDGDLETAGARLTAPPALLDLVGEFLRWSPIPPTTPRKLAEVSARLCRLLRDEVVEELQRRSPGLTSLAEEWRGLLFPQATDAQFADGYAQAVTFGLLMARAQGIPLDEGVERAASALRRTNSLIGTALRLLTDNEDNQKALNTALQTLTRVLHEVDWATLSRGDPDAWLYFYEIFLGVYDNDLRKKTGSYYTPPEVVATMVRLVDEALRDPALFGRPAGLAARDVTIADPAVGTGTFLLGVLRRIAATVAEDQGEGAVPGALTAAADRLIGFELQFGPFAVAQLRLIAEMQALIGQPPGPGGNLATPRLFITDTLGDPYAQQTQFSAMVAPIGESRRQANAIKRDEAITVVIGNPPYKDKAKGLGGWVEKGSDGRPSPLSLWSPPADWGVGQHLHNTKNLYVYFWRWATWKVFGSGHSATTGEPEADRGGLICFITAAGFLAGDGFQKMRDDLRRDCSEIWVINCSPEGHQPEVPTRVFQGVQQPVCIVLAVRKNGKDRAAPARVRYRALPDGRREDKFRALASISLIKAGWLDGARGWRAPFLPEGQGAWSEYCPLIQVFAWASPGVGPYRTWVIAPDPRSLATRWRTLVTEKDLVKKDILLKADGDRNLDKIIEAPLYGFEQRYTTLRNETESVARPIRYSFRSFDRQWLIPDHRLLSRARPDLWKAHSAHQVHLTALEAYAPQSGPAVTLTGLLPDLDHYKGSFGGRVYPLWRDAAATIPNIKPALLAHLAQAYGRAVSPEDVLAYVVALLAHPAFTARFADDLRQPGLRVPLTADPALFASAAALGREVVWLHCYGERFSNPAAGRPAAPPRMPKGTGPTIPAAGAIPGAPEPLPDAMDYDPAARRLTIGRGFIDNVAPEVAAYEVSGKNVLRQWFSYRRRDRTRPRPGDPRPPSPLDRIQPDHWLPEYTEDLLNLLHVLGRLVALEPAQAALLEQVCAGPLLTAAALTEAGALAAPETAAGPRRTRASAMGDLFG